MFARAVGQLQRAQLYQALDWMHPSLSADAKQHVAWSQLQTKLNKLGPRPDPTPTNFIGNQELCTVLKRQRVQFKANVSMGSYAVDAVLQPCDSSCPQVLLRNATKPDFIRNMPGRYCLAIHKFVIYFKYLYVFGSMLPFSVQLHLQTELCRATWS